MDITKLRLRQLRVALDGKEIGAVELSQEYLKRAKSCNGELNSYITITGEQALLDAKSAQTLIDSGKAGGLTGIPAAVKDNICTKGVKTTCGSKMLEDFVPFYDAETVGRLKGEGYVLLGKTNLDEFAMGNSNRTSAFGNVCNPHDKERVAGGSSGGSAAAVASQACGFALGTDTGGSIRQPAALCGVTGLKPTYGTVSRYGVAELAGSFDVVGPLAKCAEDCGVIMNLIADGGFDYTGLIGESVSGLKIALPKELFGDGLSDGVRREVMRTVKELEKKGAVLIEVSIPSLEYSAPAYYSVSTAESVTALSRFDGIKYGLRGEGGTYDERVRDSRTRGLGEEVKRKLMLGNYVLSSGNIEVYYRKAMAVRQRLVREFNAVFENADVIISPTSTRTAFRIDEPFDFVKNYATFKYTVFANLTGLPCVSTPCGKDGDGLPVGMSVTGKKLGEARILQVANCCEEGGV